MYAEHGVQVRGIDVSPIHKIAGGCCSAPNHLPLQRHEGTPDYMLYAAQSWSLAGGERCQTTIPG